MIKLIKSTIDLKSQARLDYLKTQKHINRFKMMDFDIEIQKLTAFLEFCLFSSISERCYEIVRTPVILDRRDLHSEVLSRRKIAPIFVDI